MNIVIDFFKKYLIIISILLSLAIVLSMSYSNFKVTSENHKVAEMYIGTLKYSMAIDGSTTNTLSVPAGETIIDVTITNENPIDTYYKLIYQNNSNVSIKYYESTKDTNDKVTNYSSPNSKITSNNKNTIKLKIVNNSTSSQKVTFKITGGFATNTLNDVTVPSGYTTINTVETPSSNTYFCTTTDTLTQGLQYVNGQYTYAYKQQGGYSSSGLRWDNIYNNGWGVQLTDKTSTDAVTSKVCTYINNKPITSMSYMFIDSQAITLDVSNFNTLNVTDMSYMFSYSQATTLDLSNFDTSKVIDMNSMFAYSEATILDISNFDTSKVTNMPSMFSYSQATTLDVSNFDTSNVTNMSYMFKGTSNLKTIYVSSKFVTTVVTDSTNMFTGSTNLIGGAGTKYNSSYVDKTYAHIDGGTSNPGYFTDVKNKPSTFSTDSWSTIISSVKVNNKRGYKVGDTKEIDLGTYGTHTLRVANISKSDSCGNSEYSESGCGFVIEFADIITNRVINSTSTTKGSWSATTIRTFVNNDIYNLLPTDLKNGILNTNVITGHGNSESNNSTSTDKLYLLSPIEIYGSVSTTYDSAINVTNQLDYYKQNNVSLKSYDSAIKNTVVSGGTGSANAWWTRTPAQIMDGQFMMVTDTGNLYSTYLTQELGVSPAFRIG